MTIDSDSNDNADDTASEASFGDGLLLWYALEGSEGGKTSPLWIGVCLLIFLIVAMIVALCG